MNKIIIALLVFCTQVIVGQTVLTNFASGQSFTFVEFRGSSYTNISVQVGSNQVLEIDGFQTGAYGYIAIIDTNYVYESIGVAYANQSLPSSLFPAPIKLAGPLTVNFSMNGGQAANGTFWATCKLIGNGPSLAAGASAQSIPSTAVVIPADAAGPVQIVLESSQDLANWVPALPGTYGTSTTNRFFRVRAVLQ